jgi:hypothetical protein
MTKNTRREFAMQLGGVAAGLTLGETVGARAASAAVGSYDLSIDITGMCGLVHDRARTRTEVIFVDTSALGPRIPKHTPVLIANLRDVMNPPQDSKPSSVVAVPSASGSGVEQLGLWDLTDQQVSIRRPGGIEATGGLRLNKPERVDEAPIGLPRDVNDPEEWRDLRYVAQMESICGQGRVAAAVSSYDNSSDQSAAQKEIPRIVAGRLRLGEGVLESAIPSQEAYRGVMFKFPRTQSRPAFSQPLTDTVSWKLAVDSAVYGNYLTIDLVPLRGSSAQPRTIMISRQGRPCRLSISNFPSLNPPHASDHDTMSMKDMGALHFGAYYALLLNEPTDKPLPEISQPMDGRKGSGFGRPFFCSPAMFSRQ